MKYYPSTTVYVTVIFLSVSIVLRSSNWFFTWVGFEISLFGFLPLLHASLSSSEASIKYFLIQASGSAIYLSSVLVQTPQLLILAMFLKLGLFPFFQWIPIVMTFMTWFGAAILTTLQKLAPLRVLFQIASNQITITLSTLGVVISAFLGFNQTLMRPLIAFSSISHTSWIVIIIRFRTPLFSYYIAFYLFITFVLFKEFKTLRTIKINQIQKKKKKVLTLTFSLIILAGVPPFSFFLFKIIALFFLRISSLTAALLILSTYVSTFYYLRFSLPTLISNWSKTPATWWLISLNIAPLLVLAYKKPRI